MADGDTFPSWRYGPDGEAIICARAADVPKGWSDHPGMVGNDPLDHDGDGSSGGSVKGYHSTAAKGARRRKARG